MEHVARAGRVDCLDLECRDLKIIVPAKPDAAVGAEGEDHGVRSLHLDRVQNLSDVDFAAGVALGLAHDVVICLRSDKNVQMAVIFIDIRPIIRRIDRHDAACLVYPLAGSDDSRRKLADVQRLCRLNIVLVQLFRGQRLKIAGLADKFLAVDLLLGHAQAEIRPLAGRNLQMGRVNVVIRKIRRCKPPQHIVADHAEDGAFQPQPRRRDHRRGHVSAAHEAVVVHAHVDVGLRKPGKLDVQILKRIAEANDVKSLFHFVPLSAFTGSWRSI